MKTKLVRDVPIGVLLIVLSVWCSAIVSYLAGQPTTLTLFAIMALGALSWKLVGLGFDIIIGIQIVDKNDKE